MLILTARKDTNTTAQRLTELEDEITKTPVMNYNPTITNTGKHDNKHIHRNKGSRTIIRCKRKL